MKSSQASNRKTTRATPGPKYLRDLEVHVRDVPTPNGWPTTRIASSGSRDLQAVMRFLGCYVLSRINKPRIATPGIAKLNICVHDAAPGRVHFDYWQGVADVHIGARVATLEELRDRGRKQLLTLIHRAAVAAARHFRFDHRPIDRAVAEMQLNLDEFVVQVGKAKASPDRRLRVVQLFRQEVGRSQVWLNFAATRQPELNARRLALEHGFADFWELPGKIRWRDNRSVVFRTRFRIGDDLFERRPTQRIVLVPTDLFDSTHSPPDVKRRGRAV